MVKFGEDGPRDLSAARALFDAACAAGSIDGCTNHGFMLMMGEAGPRDIARAAKLLDAACTANAPNACDNMGVMLMNGMNGLADFGRAGTLRSEEHTSELQPLMRIPYAVFCLQ